MRYKVGDEVEQEKFIKNSDFFSLARPIGHRYGIRILMVLIYID